MAAKNHLCRHFAFDLRIYDFSVYNLYCACPNIVHPDDPRHLVGCFELFRYALVLGHLLHQVDGSGMELLANLCQVAWAIGLGFLFVLIFHRGGSLLPCILTHAAINCVGAFASEAVLTAEARILWSASRLAIVAAYALVLLKTLPPRELSPVPGPDE